jgi:hypothetical protein
MADYSVSVTGFEANRSILMRYISLYLTVEAFLGHINYYETKNITF